MVWHILKWCYARVSQPGLWLAWLDQIIWFEQAEWAQLEPWSILQDKLANCDPVLLSASTDLPVCEVVLAELLPQKPVLSQGSQLGAGLAQADQVPSIRQALHDVELQAGRQLSQCHASRCGLEKREKKKFFKSVASHSTRTAFSEIIASLLFWSVCCPAAAATAWCSPCGAPRCWCCPPARTCPCPERGCTATRRASEAAPWWAGRSAGHPGLRRMSGCNKQQNTVVWLGNPR